MHILTEVAPVTPFVPVPIVHCKHWSVFDVVDLYVLRRHREQVPESVKYPGAHLHALSEIDPSTLPVPFPAVHVVQSTPSPAFTDPTVLFHEFAAHFWQTSMVSS